MIKENITAVVTDIHRINSSVNGNPRYMISFSDVNTIEHYTGKTVIDSVAGYAAANYTIGSEIEITFHNTRSGNILIDYIRDGETTRLIKAVNKSLAKSEELIKKVRTWA